MDTSLMSLTDLRQFLEIYETLFANFYRKLENDEVGKILVRGVTTTSE